MIELSDNSNLEEYFNFGAESLLTVLRSGYFIDFDEWIELNGGF